MGLRSDVMSVTEVQWMGLGQLPREQWMGFRCDVRSVTKRAVDWFRSGVRSVAEGAVDGFTSGVRSVTERAVNMV